MKNIVLNCILALLLFSPPSFSNSFSFEYGLSEFVLKNASPLLTQIKKRKGMGYESLKNQIVSMGCSPQILSSPSLLNKTEAYAFHSELMLYLKRCSTNNTSSNLRSVLRNKTPYLIIAGESLKSPMSYFGHSLLLFLDERDFYFSPVISVLAPTEGLTALEQLVDGGFSHIDAEVKVLPLHQIIDFYNNKESRELRFIRLNTPGLKIKKLINFFEEKSQEQLTYNFFYQNCSTYIFEALNHSCNCFGEKPNIVTPLLLAYRAQSIENTKGFELKSLFAQFNEGYRNLSSNDKKTAKEMFLDPDIEYSENPKIGKVAVQASRLSFESYRRPYSSYGRLLDTYGKDDSLLDGLPEHQSASDRSNDGLLISSAKFGLQDNAINLTLSAVDFSHFEQRSFNVLSSTLQAASIELVESNGTTKIESLDLVNIEAITPLNFVTRTPSWKLRIGADRNENNHLEGIATVGIGGAFSYSSFLFYSIPSVEISEQISFPIYSGINFKSDSFSAKYEFRNLSNRTFSLNKRISSQFGAAYSAHKKKHQELEHRLTFSYHF
ncbi:lipoprotein N-acyltransferase Lnb domain-containing protein [Marinomonas mediterranea]|jgi:hypothetical protein|nr:DUF4105 domain-containing protein [Marinomonas mediterranea]WCN15645.1 DUF4105 domain-containing protein [Marinomonas mediterranea MMB-1]